MMGRMGMMTWRDTTSIFLGRMIACKRGNHCVIIMLRRNDTSSELFFFKILRRGKGSLLLVIVLEGLRKLSTCDSTTSLGK